MFLSILKWVLISLTIIYLIHHLYMFFLNTLTVPKIKDLVNKPSQQYDEMFKTLQGNSRTAKNDMTSDDKMTEELSSFLNELKKNPEQGNGSGSGSGSGIGMSNMNSSGIGIGNHVSNNILGANEIDSYSAF
jgi:hypothetical protein